MTQARLKVVFCVFIFSPEASGGALKDASSESCSWATI